jgi:hypothetical protein
VRGAPGAAIRYRVMTRVAESLIRFIPVRVEGSNRETQLQWAAMPRIHRERNRECDDLACRGCGLFDAYATPSSAAASCADVVPPNTTS